MRETYTLDEIKEKLEHEKYLRKENQELYEELQILKECSDLANDLANEYSNRIDKAIEYIEYALDEEKVTPSKYHDWRLDLLDILKGSDKE